MNKKLRIPLMTFLGVLFLYGLLFIWVDKPVAYAMQSAYQTPLYYVAHKISLIAEYKVWAILSILVFGISLLMAYRGHHFSTRAKKILYVFTSVFVAIIIGACIKFLLARYRPELLFSEGLYGFHFFSFHKGFNSTPSGHALVIFALATALSELYRRYAFVFLGFALIVGLSRIVLEAHFLSDILLGAYIGILSAALCARHRFFAGSIHAQG